MFYWGQTFDTRSRKHSAVFDFALPMGCLGCNCYNSTLKRCPSPPALCPSECVRDSHTCPATATHMPPQCQHTSTNPHQCTVCAHRYRHSHTHMNAVHRNMLVDMGREPSSCSFPNGTCAQASGLWLVEVQHSLMPAQPASSFYSLR